MKKILLMGAVLLAMPFAVFAQAQNTVTTSTSTTSIADPGLVPGDFFYFMDRWSEALNTAFTFNKEKKARLHLEYAKERVAEIKEVLKKPDAKLEDVASAKENFDTQVADAADLVKGEKDSGADVAVLARELDDELDISRTELKGILRGHKENSGRAEAVIRAKIDAITASGTATSTNANELKGLTQALESITKEKGDAGKEESNLDADLSDEQALFEEVMGSKMAAEKHIDQAKRLREHMESIAGQAPSQVAEQLMKQAQEAMMRGDFEAAKRISKDAERGLDNAGMMEDSENIEESNVVNLEDEIKKSERMMDGIGTENSGNETSPTRR